MTSYALTAILKCTGSSETGLGRTPLVGIMSVTTTTGTTSGALQHQSSVLVANQSSAHVTSAVVRGNEQQLQVSSGLVKKSGPRNLSVSFETSREPPVEWRAKFGLLSKRKMSLPNSVRMNARGSSVDSGHCKPLVKPKSLKV